MAHHFQLLTLGAPLLVTATGEAVRYRTRKHFALLIRLALEPGRRLAREYLIDLLWPDVPAARGRHSLSQAVSVLRTTIGRQFLLAPRASLALVEGVVDVDAHRLEAGDAEIRGRFLEGFDLRGARGFDEWRDGWSARLYPRVRDCLVQRMDAGRRIGDFATVEQYARVLEELDPLAEDAVRGIIEARAWVGDRSNALKAFNQYAARLAQELQAKPSPELVRVVDLLREGKRAAPRPTEDGVPPREERRYESETIIGREDEFSVLYDAWLDVRRRRPHVVVMLGDPGIGKTTLTNAFVSSCQMEGGIIARAQAYDAERELPYAVLAELVRQLTLQRAIGAAEPEALADLSRLAPDVLTVFPGVPKPEDWPPEVVPLRLADAFLKAVSAAAEDNPVVLVVDDIHAADNASVAILHMLARKLAGLRLLLILTARQGDVRTSTAARALITDAGLETLSSLELDTLSHESAAILVARVSAKGCERWGEVPVARVVRLGGGNPLALELLSREWVARGDQSLVGSLDALNALPAPALTLPQAVKAVYERQTEQLEDKTRAVLDLGAVLGRRLSDLRLYEIIGCTEGEALTRLTQLLDTRLLREVAGQLEFRNELVRAHAYYEVPSTLRLELHRRVAKRLEQLTDDKTSHELEIAWHYIIGRDPQSAARYALEGAERSLSEGAPREAELILHALDRDHLDVATSRNADLVLSAALIGQSRAEEALPVLDELLKCTLAPKREAARAVRLYASAMYLLSRGAKAHSDTAERALHLARECGDNDLLAHALFEYARAGVETGNVGSIENARDELSTVLYQETEAVPSVAYYADAYCRYHLLDIEQALESAKKAVASLVDEKKQGELARAYNALGNCEMARCRLDQAREAYGLAIPLWKKVGDDNMISIATYNLGNACLMRGSVDEAIRAFEDSLRVGRQAPAQPGLLRSWSSLAIAYILHGQSRRAFDCLDSMKRWMQSGDRSWAITIEFCSEAAEIELAIGDEGEALRLVTRIEQDLRDRGCLSLNNGTDERLRVFLAYHTQGVEVARSLAEEFLGRFKGRHLLAQIETVAALAWLDRKTLGKCSEETLQEILFCKGLGATGKEAILAAQGFSLLPSQL